MYTLLMKMLIGLGNPGEKYQNTRHNVGFMMVDFIVSQIKNKISKIKNKKYIAKLKFDKYLQAEVAQIEIHNERVILVRPQTFMNQSGRVVKSVVDKFQIDIGHELYIIHDDLDIRLGEYKIQKGKGPKLHNGIASIEKELSVSDFWRVRIGIDNRHKETRIPGETYVLQDFFREEKERLNEVFIYIFYAFRYPKAQ